MARTKKSVIDEVALMKKGERFEVRRNGAVLASTEYVACYPDRQRREELRKAGYRLYLGGKLFKEEKEK